MRILSYNILDGGAGRLDLLRQVVVSERPDVVGLVEADDLGIVEALPARRFRERFRGRQIDFDALIEGGIETALELGIEKRGELIYRGDLLL